MKEKINLFDVIKITIISLLIAISMVIVSFILVMTNLINCLIEEGICHLHNHYRR